MPQRPRAEAEEWMLGPFVRAESNPIIAPSGSVFFCPMRRSRVRWEALHTFNPAAVVRDGRVYVLYRAEDDTGAMDIGAHTSRIGLAESGDGLHFTRRSAPVLYPGDDSQKDNEWDGGCEDPRVVQGERGTFVMTYTQWNRKLARLAVATSTDLVHWTKRGPAFARHGGEWADRWSKSGAIVTRLDRGRLRAAKIHDKYWMYFGDQEVRVASSDNLIDWVPGEIVLPRRPGRFDSALTEAGPPAVVTDRGIVLLYNSMNDREHGDASLPPGRYSAGQALFSIDRPGERLARTDDPFFRPERSYETTGQYSAGNTFLEGLVWFRDQWFLFYGAADARVAAAVWRPERGAR